MAQSDQCVTCAHYWGAHTCDAFPEGIPSEIVKGEFDHRSAYPGDHGVRWEASPEYIEIQSSESMP